MTDMFYKIAKAITTGLGIACFLMFTIAAGKETYDLLFQETEECCCVHVSVE